MLRHALVLAALLASSVETLPVAAADYAWSEAAGGVFTASGSWQPVGGPGGVNDSVSFDLGAPPRDRYVVTGVAGVNHALSIRSDSLTLEFSGPYSLPNMQAGVPNFVVGVDAGDVADVILTGQGGAAFQSHRTFIGSSSGSYGAVSVVGSDWQWDVGGQVMVGWYGTGVLTIEGGASVLSSAPLIGIFEGALGTVTVRGSGSSWIASGQMSVGVGGMGTLDIEEGGSVASGSASVGNSNGSRGSASIRGARSSWDLTSELFVGYGASGALVIEEGGRLMAGDAWLGGWVDEGFGTAAVAVRNADSSFELEQDCGGCEGGLTVGASNSAILTIEDGGQVSNVSAWLGFNPGATGEVTVAGVGSSWENAAQLFVGEAGSGTLRVEAGAILRSTDGWLGVEPDAIGAVTVRGVGSRWDNGGLLFAGSQGTASLRIEDGAAVSNGAVWLGLLFGSTSTVTIAGTDSWWEVDGALRVGYSGDATLRIEGGGSVTSSSADVAATAGSISTATVSGTDSVWESGTLHIGSAGTGTLTIQDGGRVESGDGIIGDRGRVRVYGADSVLTVSGSLEMERERQAGTLEIGIAGPSAYGFVDVADAVELVGDLELTLLGGLPLTEEDILTVLTCGTGITGAFDNVANGQSLGTTEGLGSFVVHYGPMSEFDPNRVILSDFIATPEPDALLAAWAAIAVLSWLRRRPSRT